eukprot:3131196-Rhodomonas_salina.4
MASQCSQRGEGKLGGVCIGTLTGISGRDLRSRAKLQRFGFGDYDILRFHGITDLKGTAS